MSAGNCPLAQEEVASGLKYIFLPAKLSIEEARVLLIRYSWRRPSVLPQHSVVLFSDQLFWLVSDRLLDWESEQKKSNSTILRHCRFAFATPLEDLHFFRSCCYTKICTCNTGGAAWIVIKSSSPDEQDHRCKQCGCRPFSEGQERVADDHLIHTASGHFCRQQVRNRDGFWWATIAPTIYWSNKSITGITRLQPSPTDLGLVWIQVKKIPTSLV